MRAIGKVSCVTFARVTSHTSYKQDPLSFINDFEPKGLQSDNRIDFVVVVVVVVVVVIIVVDVVVIFVGEIACLSLN